MLIDNAARKIEILGQALATPNCFDSWFTWYFAIARHPGQFIRRWRDLFRAAFWDRLSILAAVARRPRAKVFITLFIGLAPREVTEF